MQAVVTQRLKTRVQRKICTCSEQHYSQHPAGGKTANVYHPTNL